MDELIEFHIKHDYYIRVQQLLGNACVVTYPPITIYEDKVDEFTISFVSEEEHIIVSEMERPSYSVEIPDFSHRVIILADIVARAGVRNISSKLFAVHDKAGDFLSRKTGHVLPSPNTKEKVIQERRVTK